MDAREIKFLEMEKEVNSRGGDGAAVVEAYKELYDFHELGLCTWLAKLFDPDIGGFYYSNSGRDNEWVEWEGKRVYTKPDMESTHQAVTLMRTSGMIQNYEDIPDWMREKIKNFTCSLMSEEDGYIYHPQWGKAISNARLGRDLIAAVGTADVLKFDLPYPTATQRIKAAAAAAPATEGAPKVNTAPSLPDHLKSKEAFVKYLENLPWEEPTGLAAYGAGNALASQASLINAAGLSDVMCDFLDSIQHEDGLWGTQRGYAAINAFFKIGVSYGSARRVIPNVEKVAYSGMDIMVDDELNRTVCYQFNAWWTMMICLGNLKAYGGEDGEKATARVKAEMLRRAPECIRATTRKIRPFKCEDGSYSYFYDTTCPTSQGAIVANMIKEGDINATTINSQGVLNRSLDALGLSKFAPRIFGKEGHDAFFSALRTPTK
jgi:hypothetical protein